MRTVWVVEAGYADNYSENQRMTVLCVVDSREVAEQIEAWTQHYGVWGVNYQVERDENNDLKYIPVSYSRELAPGDVQAWSFGTFMP